MYANQSNPEANAMQTTQESHKRSSSDIAAMLPSMSFMTIVTNDKHNRVELHVRGEFNAPDANTKEFAELYQLAEMYPTLLIYINSPGGQINTLVELQHVIEKFTTVVTVVNGDAASAGFMLWCLGDIRVVSPNSELMAHRESYGMMGKTDQHLDRAEFAKRRFEKIIHEFCGDVLSDEEMERARTTEVWLSGEDMIERGVAIDWHQFQTRDTAPLELATVVCINDKHYLQLGNDQILPVEIHAGTEILPMTHTVYTYTEDDVVEQEGAPDAADALRDSLNEFQSKWTDASKAKLQDELRQEAGKGNFQVRKDGSVKIKDQDGKWIDLIDYLNQ